VAAHESAFSACPEDAGKRLVDRPVDRAGREDRSDEPDAKRDPAPLDELADELGLLRGRRRVQVADQLPELLLRELRSKSESEDADDEGKERDRGEEQLEGDRAREERAFVVPERPGDGARVADECPDRCQDAASLFGDGLSGAFDSDLSAFLSPLVSPFVSVFVSPLESPFVSVLLSPFFSALADPSDEPFSAGRLSVLYQPEPLKTIAGIDRRRRGFFPQLGHFSSDSSLNDWTAENTWPQ
jgi:hypothetical protein